MTDSVIMAVITIDLRGNKMTPFCLHRDPGLCGKQVCVKKYSLSELVEYFLSVSMFCLNFAFDINPTAEFNKLIRHF